MVKIRRVESIRKACEINDAIFLEIVENFQFKTERDLEKYILKRFRQEGVGQAYRPIVANNNSVIHAKPRDKKFSRGFLVLDFGCKFNGWCSDMTRTIFIGKASKKDRERYALVLNCQRKCISKVKAGVKTFDLDVLSRRLLGDYKKSYRHWLGHGVGKKVHEDPVFGIFSNDVLQDGQVITIEPGIYIKNKKEEFGIRVEDTILVNRTGREVLCKASKKFIEVSKQPY
jgi:Xaa-Pro aminopeptidase